MAQVGRGVFEDQRTIVGKEETEEVLFRLLADGGRGHVGAQRQKVRTLQLKLGGSLKAAINVEKMKEQTETCSANS